MLAWHLNKFPRSFDINNMFPQLGLLTRVLTQYLKDTAAANNETKTRKHGAQASPRPRQQNQHSATWDCVEILCFCLLCCQLEPVPYPLYTCSVPSCRVSYLVWFYQQTRCNVIVCLQCACCKTSWFGLRGLDSPSLLHLPLQLQYDSIVETA